MTITLDRVIYFDFDSYAVKDEFRPIVEAHANLLKKSSGAKEVAEGHTDERGGSEYNLALGQKRAEAVVKQMEVLGVGESQLEAVSSEAVDHGAALVATAIAANRVRRGERLRPRRRCGEKSSGVRFLRASSTRSPSGGRLSSWRCEPRVASPW